MNSKKKTFYFITFLLFLNVKISNKKLSFFNILTHTILTHYVLYQMTISMHVYTKKLYMTIDKNPSTFYFKLWRCTILEWLSCLSQWRLIHLNTDLTSTEYHRILVNAKPPLPFRIFYSLSSKSSYYDIIL